MQNSDADLDKAWDIAREGNYREAAVLLEAQPGTPQKPHRLAALAHFYFMMNNLDSAIHYANQALELNPRLKLALMTIGAVHHKSRNYEEALKFYQESFRWHPEDVFAGLRLAAVMIDLHNYQAAIDILEKLRSIDSKNRELLGKLEMAYLFAGDAPKSKQIRDIQNELFAGDADRSVDTLMASLESKPPDDAIRMLEKIMTVSIYQVNPKMNRKMSELLIKEHRFADAIPYLRKLLAGSSRSDNLRLKLAACLARSGGYQEALELLNAMPYLMDSPAWQTVQVEALAAAGKMREAMDSAFQSLLKHPRNRRLRQLVIILKKRGCEPSPGILEKHPHSGP
jgi:tetratricopeptide (TPR) repeat protein